MNLLNYRIILLVILFPLFSQALTWKEAKSKKDQAWFLSNEGQRVTQQVLAYQYPSGGWPKNIDMVKPVSAQGIQKIANGLDYSTIDNGSTYSQIRYLVYAYRSAPSSEVLDSIQNGLNYLFESQQNSGGWPVYYPRTGSYYALIHFNDNSVVGVLKLMKAIANNEPAFMFLDDSFKKKAKTSLNKGIECILNTQVEVDGQLTIWCAQHDPVTFAPIKARTFEPVSLSGYEGAMILSFLMSLESPDSRIVEAVKAANLWFETHSIWGKRVIDFEDEEGADRKVIEDPEAGPLWARFYEIGSNRPIFSGRDSIIRYDFNEIERERRTGYKYYSADPIKVLSAYPMWLEHFLGK